MSACRRSEHQPAEVNGSEEREPWTDEVFRSLLKPIRERIVTELDHALAHLEKHHTAYIASLQCKQCRCLVSAPADYDVPVPKFYDLETESSLRQAGRLDFAMQRSGFALPGSSTVEWPIDIDDDSTTDTSADAFPSKTASFYRTSTRLDLYSIGHRPSTPIVLAEKVAGAKRPSRWRRLAFFKQGLFGLTRQKRDYVELVAKLKAQEANVTALNAQHLENQQRFLKESPMARKLSSYEGQHPQSSDRVPLLQIYEELDNIICKYSVPFWCARGGFELFVGAYQRDREKVRSGILSDEPDESMQEMGQMLDELSSNVEELNTMSNFIKERIDSHEQLPFKMALLFLNFLTLLSEFIWASWIKPKFLPDLV